jgi:hypothetical protein
MTDLHIVDGVAQERAKYAEIWSLPEYKLHSPGLQNVDRFMEVIKPAAGYSLIDIGCGAGVAGLEFERKGLQVTWMDLTDAGLDPAVNRNRFIESPIWSDDWVMSHRMGWDFGFCCDVMEHIPTEYVMLSVERILSACRLTWFQIALRPDEFGKFIGEPLHLTVQPFEWWLLRLSTIGNVIDARDLCGDGMYVVTQ